MSLISMTDYEDVSPEVRAAFDDQIAKNGRVTNMKRTLLHNVPAFDAYMAWYTLHDQLVPVIGERGVALFSYAISTANECLICSTFFRKILVDGGEDPDALSVGPTEQLLMDFGRAISRTPNAIPDEIYQQLQQEFDEEQLVLLIAFAGIMVATNLFNTVAKVDLDDVLTDYAPESFTGV